MQQMRRYIDWMGKYFVRKMIQIQLRLGGKWLFKINEISGC